MISLVASYQNIYEIRLNTEQWKICYNWHCMKFKWKVLVLVLYLGKCMIDLKQTLSTQGKDISSEGIQQPNIFMVLKKIQSATGVDSYWTCLVIFIFQQIKLDCFSNHFFPSIKIKILIVFCRKKTQSNVSNVPV